MFVFSGELHIGPNLPVERLPTHSDSVRPLPERVVVGRRECVQPGLSPTICVGQVVSKTELVTNVFLLVFMRNLIASVQCPGFPVQVVTQRIETLQDLYILPFELPGRKDLC